MWASAGRAIRVGVLLALAGAFADPRPLLAQDAPPTAPPAAPPAGPATGPAGADDPFAKELDEIRRLVKAGAWKSAKLAIDRFFQSHEGDRRVVAHLTELESGLQSCLFRLDGKQPTDLQLLGRGAVRWDPASGMAEFACERYEAADGWTALEDIYVLDALFDGEVSVEMTGAHAVGLTVMLGFDSETKGAYAFVPARGDIGGYEVSLLRFDPGSPKPAGLGKSSHFADYCEVVRYSLQSSRVEVFVHWPRQVRSKSRDDVTSVPDAKYRKGFVAVKSQDGLGARRLRIKGRLDKTFAKRQIAEADTRRRREWVASSWQRAAALPIWVLEAEEAGRAWTETLPKDCPAAARSGLRELQRFCFEGGAAAPDVPAGGYVGAPGASAWAAALRASARGRHADAEAHGRKLLGSEPDFAPAHTLVGAVLLARGLVEEAVASFETARARDPLFAPAYDALALAAFRVGDFDRAQSVLAEAAASGVGTRTTGELRLLVHRARRGPDWKKRHEFLSPSFTVVGDAGYEVCGQVAKVLEEALRIYAEEFRRRPQRTRARVLVFSGEESYLGHLAEMGIDGRGTVGMYLSRLRELCVFLHEDRPVLWETVRHEAFHQYLHEFLEDAPIWFNEGYAEFFGFSRRVMGKARVGQVGEDQAAAAKRLLPKFSPLRSLFVMEQAEFMAAADVHYVQSWAIVHLLRGTTDRALSGVLSAYLDALLAGRSREEAYEQVLAPVADRIQSALQAHVGSLGAR